MPDMTALWSVQQSDIEQDSIKSVNEFINTVINALRQATHQYS
ncbi:MAG: hypothetical protein ACTS73_09105 [Arsenophonus sp. NEOnobi-MAG3]